MKIVDGSWSLVLAGKWNRYILTPEWVGRNLFESEKIEVEFPINRPDIPPRYRSTDNIIIMPALHRCQFIAQRPYSEDTLKKISLLAIKLVAILVHTPLSAVGVNFSFEEKVENFKKLELFSLFDSNNFIDYNYKVNLTEIRRQIQLEQRVLNFTITYDGNTIIFDFNFNYDINDSNMFQQVANDNLIISNRDIALKILEEIYELEVDDIED